MGKSNKLYQLALFGIGGTIGLSTLMALLLCAIPGLYLILLLALGSISGAILGFFQGKAFGSPAINVWIKSTAVAGAISAPLVFGLFVILIFIYPASVTFAVGGLILGIAIGLSQLLFARKRFRITWLWVPINSIALALGFFIAVPLAQKLGMGFYACFSPGWTTVGAIAGFTYGIILGIFTISFKVINQLDTLSEEKSHAS